MKEMKKAGWKGNGLKGENETLMTTTSWWDQLGSEPVHLVELPPDALELPDGGPGVLEQHVLPEEVHDQDHDEQHHAEPVASARSAITLV